MKLTFFGNSDIGRVRRTNEDNFSGKRVAENEHLFIIADGMGGHQAGEVASKLGITSFIRKYRKLRKHGLAVEESMVKSMKQANSSILKRALTDPYKRGMGTTFTALVIYNRKATIVHVGDSRIYLIRNNKIKKITTDHTFVEKMLKEGKISEEEARDHPQKNILYMSLGARESYIPEIINDMPIKKGDVITMCSDGLNNMVEDETIKKYSLGNDPEESVNALIDLANENGGGDNITIQIIHAGPSAKKRKRTSYKQNHLRKVSVSLILTLVFSMALFLLNLKNIESSIDNPGRVNTASLISSGHQAMKTTGKTNKQNLFKINAPDFPSHLSRDDFLFFSGDFITFRQKNDISVYSISKQKTAHHIYLKPFENIIPSIFSPAENSSSRKIKSIQSKQISEHIYIFRKAKTTFLTYRVIEKNSGKTLITIQSDLELNSVDHESRTVKFIKLTPPLDPIFMNKRAFIFHDQKSYYVIENPVKQKNNEIKFYKIRDVRYSSDCIISVNVNDDAIGILFFNTKKKIINKFEIPISDQSKQRKIHFEFAEKPINIEYINENSTIVYLSNGYIDIKKNNSFFHNYYVFQNENIAIQKILLDLSASRRILVDTYNRLFVLII